MHVTRLRTCHKSVRGFEFSFGPRHSGAERVTSLELDPGCHGRPSLLDLRLKTDGKDRSPSEDPGPGRCREVVAASPYVSCPGDGSYRPEVPSTRRAATRVEGLAGEPSSPDSVVLQGFRCLPCCSREVVGFRKLPSPHTEEAQQDVNVCNAELVSVSSRRTPSDALCLIAEARAKWNCSITLRPGETAGGFFCVALSSRVSPLSNGVLKCP